MIAKLIHWSIANRFLVLLATVMVAAWGVISLLRTPLDALPDLSDVQVIIRTTYPGQAPRIVENQITYPLTTTMLSVPGAKTVRGYSFFGDSFVYVLFEDGTDHVLGALARARVSEPGAVASACGSEGVARPGRDGRRMDLSVCAGRSQRHAGCVAVACAAGLVSQVRAEDGARCRRSRFDRRHGAAVSDRARSRQACRLRHRAHAGDRRDRQVPIRRPAARCSSWARPNTWCARRATCSRSTTSGKFR